MEQTVVTYKPSLASKIVFGIGATLFLGVSVLLQFLQHEVNTEEGKALILKAFLFAIVLGVLILYLFIKQLRRPNFSVTKTAVTINGKDTIALKDITDVYLFLSGKYINNLYNNLAFRTGENEPWQCINANYSGNLDTMLDAYLPVRAAKVLADIAAHKTVSFNYISTKEKWTKGFFATGTADFLKVKTQQCKLSETGIVINEKQFKYSDLQPLHSANTRFSLRDKQSNIIFEYEYKNMMSADVFAQVLNEKIANG